MKDLIKENLSYGQAALTILVILSITVFCQLNGFPLIIPLLLLFAGIHLFVSRKADYRLFLNLGLLLTLIVVAAFGMVTYADVNMYYIPVACLAMLTILLFHDLQLAFLMAFISSALVSLILGGGLNTALIFFLGSLTAAYTVKDARTRGTLIGAGFYTGLIQAVAAALILPDKGALLSREFLSVHLYPLFINGFICAATVMIVLKVFEWLFGSLTNFSLIELSDFNHPLLKRMILEAPGTYHHSLVVSNLSEAAADAVGANPLLTRVGAYYHDIGKMEKPEYFTENQLVGGNKHDIIEPSISRLVILNHVKEGVELAKKYKLNQQIIDFIPQHHGTSLMFFFYQKALEDAKDDVDEENYRYPGPKPQRKETAIVLLADSVEGATRAIDEPNPVKIEEVVRKVINNKFIDGQLDECNLTLKEIETIAQTFTRILSAMYHGRVKYPEKKSGNGDKKERREDRE